MNVYSFPALRLGLQDSEFYRFRRMQGQQLVSLETLTDLCTPRCIHVVATQRIADHIAAGITDIGGLAAPAGRLKPSVGCRPA